MQHVEGALGEQPLRLARAGRLDDVVAGVAQRAAERLEDFFFVVDEEDRAAVASSGDARRESRPACRAASTGRSMRISVPRARRARHGDRAAEALDDVLGDRQAEAGAAALGREVGIEDARQVGRRRCRRRDRRSTIATRSPSVAVRSVISGPAADRPLGAPSPFTAWRALTSMLTSAMRSRSASVVDVGSDRIEVERDRRRPGPTPAPRPPTRGRAR